MILSTTPCRAALLFAEANRLPPPLRAKAMMALLGLIVLGIGLIAMVVLGGLIVKRLARHRSRPTEPRDDSWYQKPLEPDAPADAPANDDDS
jgi:tellurite resistance protein TehA-like permease